jgi:hypothetical protein
MKGACLWVGENVASMLRISNQGRWAQARAGGLKQGQGGLSTHIKELQDFEISSRIELIALSRQYDNPFSLHL